jgi:hypothetical protein
MISTSKKRLDVAREEETARLEDGGVETDISLRNNSLVSVSEQQYSMEIVQSHVKRFCDTSNMNTMSDSQ